ncbi:MAG: CRISPR-associated endoribonuclease Cas6 [Deltaproteobacteria bacterium]|nr:CRISPR-associated endoribonuclease Cas6 [Deltaproteobacteria bacterium]
MRRESIRLLLELASEKHFIIPIHYNYHIQSFLYNSISPKLAKILHDHGFPIGKRRFKLFTFSRILGEYRLDRNKEKIVFSSPFRLIVSSVMREFIEEIAEELMRKESAKILSQKVSLNSVEVSDLAINQDKLKIKMLSPITIYSTLSRADGKKKTYYYSPFEKEFSQLISENAKKKFKAFYEKEPNGDIQLTPLNVNKSNERIIFYKGIVIKGWMGIYGLSGDHELMKLAYDAGLGGKNSQGFGCFEVLGRKNFRDED